MSLLKIILPNSSAKFQTFYNLVEIILIFSQVNISRSQDSNYYDNSTNNYDYISDVIGRYKRQNLNSGVNCELPSNPLHGRYAVLGDSVNSYKPGDFANEFRVLEIHCNRGFALSPFERNITICVNGSWYPLLTGCLRTCPLLISTETTTVKCSLNNTHLKNCATPVMGTRAILSCNSWYEDHNIQRSPIRVCRANGWYPATSTCYPACGNKNAIGVPTVIGGQHVTIGDYPWQIGIYNSTTKAFICGGSVIEQNIILTAAHCVTNYEGVVQPTAQYSVTAGKYFSRYDDPRDLFAQYSNVHTIHVPNRYTGRINAFAEDIAVLILETHFTLSERVQPVCIALNDDQPDLSFLSASDNGVVTGWGYTVESGVVSDVLKELIIPVIPFHKCSSEIPEEFRRYFTADKICGGFLNNRSSVCSGDSGGSLVFKNLLNNRYFVRGIVSTSPATEALTCDPNQYSLFTSLDQHIEFVRDLVADNQFRSPIEYSNCHNEENQIDPNLGTTGLLVNSPLGLVSNFILDKHYPRHCIEVRESGQTASGIYMIQPDRAPKPFQVVCDLETRGGNWTVIQRRFDGSQDFYLGWEDYKKGFGNLRGEFWLGLDNIHLLTGYERNELLVDLGDFESNNKTAYYSWFSVGSEVEGYELQVLHYSGDAGNSLGYHSGCKFSTKDMDQDNWSDSCAIRQEGAWWYNNCYTSNLNGKYYGRGEEPESKQFVVTWDDFDYMYKALKHTRMSVRPKVSRNPLIID